MEESDPHTHSFILKIWRERRNSRAEQFAWRGHITHVPDGERRSVRRLSDVVLFIARYLLLMGVWPGWGYRLLRLAYAFRRRP